jgi:hypothetical protein
VKVALLPGAQALKPATSTIANWNQPIRDRACRFVLGAGILITQPGFRK